MKKILLSIAMLCMALGGRAETETQDVCQGWPANYGGVMLQGFWWDSYNETTWAKLTARADELSQYFDLIWVPNSGTVSNNPSGFQGPSMGYDPCFWLHHNSCFGTESELRSMINTYKSLNVGIIEDVVINHKKGQKSWLDFPDEEVTVDNITYKIDWKGHPENYITCNDDCNSQGYATHGGYDTGDDFPGFRDLDHTSSVTQENIINYLQFLKNGLGYVGFRYDLVKGYAPGFIKDYNDASMPEFSVGEYWDDQTSIQNWIMNTGNRSAAFDFPLKYKINQAISNGDYSAFDWKSFAFDPNFSKYAVTFVDNHDTGREDHSRLVNNWSAANAFILASPGTPCVWYKHYLADASNIQKMILARKACGITNTYCIVEEQYPVNNNTGYILKTVGHKGSLYLQLGSAVGDTPYGYEFVCSGDSYKLYSSINDFASVTVSPNGGNFTTSTQKVTFAVMNAIENGASYKVGDGENWTLITEDPIYIGENVDFNTDITVYWRATGSDEVEHTGSVTFTKRASYPKPIVENNDEVSVFFETDQKKVTIWAWNEEPYVGFTGSDWDLKPEMKVMGLNSAGKLVYKWVCESGLPENVIFDYGIGQTETLDFVNHGYYTASGLLYKLENNTVYFDNTVSDWDHVYYYAWTKNGECEHEWPGVELEAGAGGLYEVSNLDGIYTSIIFNNPNATGVKQTEDLTIVDGKIYSLTANTVTFDNTVSNWNKVYYYAYTKDETPKTRWPGEVLTANTDGKYSVALQDAYTTVIFNDGTEYGSIVGLNQTENLAVENGKEYALKTYTVYYDNSQSNWEHVHCYAYANDQIHKVDWPGEVISEISDNLYEITLLEGYKYLVFNDGNGGVKRVNQTEDLTAEDGMTYKLTTNTIYFDNSQSNWSEVYYYAFTEDETPKKAWPGEKIPSVNSAGLYEVTLMEGYTKVVFNNNPETGIVGVNQTGNLIVEDGKIYTLNGGANNQNGYTIYFDNTNNWGAVYAYIWKDNSNLIAEWPGNNISEKDGLYMVHVDDASYDNIIFHENTSGIVGETKTNDLKAIDGRVYTVGGVTENLVLTEGYAYYNANEFTATTAKYSRSTSNHWGTIILPFEIESDENVQYYELKSISDATMTFEEVASVPAGRPALFYMEEPGTLTINVSNVQVVPTADDNKYGSDVSEWYLNGTYKTVKKASTDNNHIYYIANDYFWRSEKEGGTYHSIDAKPFRAWMEYASSEPLAARFRISDEADPEGIELIHNEAAEMPIYDLYGRQHSAPKKGFNVINGKLILIK